MDIGYAIPYIVSFLFYSSPKRPLSLSDHLFLCQGQARERKLFWTIGTPFTWYGWKKLRVLHICVFLGLGRGQTCGYIEYWRNRTAPHPEEMIIIYVTIPKFESTIPRIENFLAKRSKEWWDFSFTPAWPGVDIALPCPVR